MGTVLDGVTKDTISNYNLIETVRSSNDILSNDENRKNAEQELALDASATALDELVTDVGKLDWSQPTKSDDYRTSYS